MNREKLKAKILATKEILGAKKYNELLSYIRVMSKDFLDPHSDVIHYAMPFKTGAEDDWIPNVPPYDADIKPFISLYEVLTEEGIQAIRVIVRDKWIDWLETEVLDEILKGNLWPVSLDYLIEGLHGLEFDSEFDDLVFDSLLPTDEIPRELYYGRYQISSWINRHLNEITKRVYRCVVHYKDYDDGSRYITGEKEEWRKIKESKGRYLISNKGRVYSTMTDKVLKPTINWYFEEQLCVKLQLMDSATFRMKSKTRCVNRLVWDAFVGESSETSMLIAKNGDNSDCRLENLVKIDNKDTALLNRHFKKKFSK